MENRPDLSWESQQLSRVFSAILGLCVALAVMQHGKVQMLLQGRSFIIKFRVFCSHLHRDLPNIWGLSLILFGVSLCVLVCVCRHKFWLGDAVALNSYQHLQVSSPPGTISQNNSSSL